MNAEIRPTEDPKRFTIHEGDEWIGEIVKDEDIENGVIMSDEHLWLVEVWSQMGTGKKWAQSCETWEEAEKFVRQAHQGMAGERRELSKGSRPPTISTPMGGQRRR
ncbi:hypothetical protein [Streptomyces sp. NBC_00356]|uniref:hypothetical protein n=1 Tax=Streptomyces sp. NBC_00356 TaxID=2975724 RepID=UPI002E26EAAC